MNPAIMNPAIMNPAMLRRYAAEFVGTFGIVFAPVALSASGHFAGGDAGLMAAAWVSGLAVLAMIYALGHISAAHFNPAVTLGFAAAGRFPWRYAAPYWAAELLGGIVAAGLAALLFRGGHGAHVPAVRPLSRAVVVEAVLTFSLMLVIIAVATDRRVAGAVPGLAIGLTVVFDVLIGGPVTGGSMNPARSLGPALYAGHAALSVYWAYVVGPALGAVVAARLYEAIRGGERHAQGAPNDLHAALHEIEENVLPLSCIVWTVSISCFSDRPRRESFQMTSVSPGRMKASASVSPGRAALAPLALSSKTRSHCASFSASLYNSSF